jgi:O-antigen/teichoic acid export membrane protein
LRQVTGERGESTGQTIAGAAAAAAASQVVIYLAALPTSVLIARAVGAEGRGQYYLIVIAGSACVMLMTLSIEAANAVLLAERRYSLSALTRNATFMAIVFAPVAIALMLLAFLVGRSTVFEGVSSSDYLIVAGAVPFSVHLAWLAGFMSVTRQLVRSQSAFAAGALVNLGGALALYLSGNLGVTEVVILYCTLAVVPWILHVRWLRRIAPLRPAVDRRLLLRTVSLGAGLHPAHLFFYLLLRFDVFLVAYYLDVSDVGQYSLAVIFADLVWVLTYGLVQASVAPQVEQELERSASLVFKVVRFNAAAGAVVCAGLAATMWAAIPFVYGDGFGDSYAALLALLPGAVAMAASRPLGLYLARQRRPMLYVGFPLVAFALNCALNLILLPRIGIVGAGVASSAAYIVLAVAYTTWALRASGLGVAEALAPRSEDLDSMRAGWRHLRAALPP